MRSESLLNMLSRHDALAPVFIAGEDLIAQAAGLKDVDNFFLRYMTQDCCRSRVTDGIKSIHTPFGHYWSVLGRPFTHPNSAAAWGVNIRNHNRQARRARVPGWYGPRACPVSACSAVYGPIATTLNGLMHKLVDEQQ
jgi:hypothetical protein